jgi:hypothetical protein
MKHIPTIEKLTITVVVIAAIKLLIGGGSVSYYGKTITMGPPDAGAIGAVLAPVLTAWAASKHRSFRDKDGDGVPDDEQPPVK